jgi:general secretion pathway protein K
MNSRSGSVLIGVLWCFALLSVIVITLLHTVSIDLRVAKNFEDSIQAHYLALAGIEKAKALIYHEAALRRTSAKSHSGELYDDPRDFKSQPLGRGEFQILRSPGENENARLIYGISDEESRLNVNTASADELKKLYGMKPGTAAAILDWRDQDNNVSPGGAEVDYYASLPQPYLPRNGPFETIRELLMVSGMDREALLGEDANQNGLLDPEEDDGEEWPPSDNHDGTLDSGWSGLLTVNSITENVNAAGENRVNVQTADEAALTRITGITTEIAKAIIAYRGQNKLENLADLLEVAAADPRPQNPSAQAQGSPNRQAGNVPNSGPDQTSGNPTQQPGGGGNQPLQFNGPKLISTELLIQIADDVTTSSDSSQSGLVNINTAPARVLACLQGITDELAQAIISYRQSAGAFASIAGLLQVPGISKEIFKQAAPRITARSETFRILSEGRVKSSGATRRIQEIIHLGAAEVETLGYREDL